MSGYFFVIKIFFECLRNVYPLFPNAQTTVPKILLESFHTRWALLKTMRKCKCNKKIMRRRCSRMQKWRPGLHVKAITQPFLHAAADESRTKTRRFSTSSRDKDISKLSSQSSVICSSSHSPEQQDSFNHTHTHTQSSSSLTCMDTTYLRFLLVHVYVFQWGEEKAK